MSCRSFGHARDDTIRTPPLRRKYAPIPAARRVLSGSAAPGFLYESLSCARTRSSSPRLLPAPPHSLECVLAKARHIWRSRRCGFRVHTDNGSFLAHSTRAANCLRSQSDPSHSGPRPALHDSVPKATRSLWFVLGPWLNSIWLPWVEQFNHLLLQYGRGKVAVGKASRLSRFSCLWQAYLVQLSLFGFGLSELGDSLERILKIWKAAKIHIVIKKKNLKKGL